MPRLKAQIYEREEFDRLTPWEVQDQTPDMQQYRRVFPTLPKKLVRQKENLGIEKKMADRHSKTVHRSQEEDKKDPNLQRKSAYHAQKTESKTYIEEILTNLKLNLIQNIRSKNRNNLHKKSLNKSLKKLNIDAGLKKLGIYHGQAIARKDKNAPRHQRTINHSICLNGTLRHSRGKLPKIQIYWI